MAGVLCLPAVRLPAGAPARQPQAHLLLPGAAHPEAQRRRVMRQRQGDARGVCGGGGGGGGGGAGVCVTTQLVVRPGMGMSAVDIGGGRCNKHSLHQPRSTPTRALLPSPPFSHFFPAGRRLLLCQPSPRHQVHRLPADGGAHTLQVCVCVVVWWWGGWGGRGGGGVEKPCMQHFACLPAMRPAGCSIALCHPNPTVSSHYYSPLLPIIVPQPCACPLLAQTHTHTTTHQPRVQARQAAGEPRRAHLQLQLQVHLLGGGGAAVQGGEAGWGWAAAGRAGWEVGKAGLVARWEKVAGRCALRKPRAR